MLCCGYKFAFSFTFLCLGIELYLYSSAVEVCAFAQRYMKNPPLVYILTWAFFIFLAFRWCHIIGFGVVPKAYTMLRI